MQDHSQPHFYEVLTPQFFPKSIIVMAMEEKQLKGLLFLARGVRKIHEDFLVIPERTPTPQGWAVMVTELQTESYIKR